MRDIIIAGNWKLNKNLKESLELVNSLKRDLYQIEACQIVVCPVFTALAEVADTLVDSNIKLGAQDLYWEASGAFTGEVSADLLKDAGCEYVIIGHSERRQFFAETDETVNRKLKAALSAELIPIVCCGELLKERESGQMQTVIEKQIRGAYKTLTESEVARIVIAYEPVWAIGTGKVATPEQAQEAHAFIRKILKELYNDSVASKTSILYGGSVKAENAHDLLKQSDVDGALVGGASLKNEQFSAIVKTASTVRV